MQKVAIIIPAYQAKLSPSEKISLNHLEKYCADFPWFLVHPEGLDFHYSTEKFQKIALPAQHFKNTGTYSQLCLSPEFYQLFADYDYILIYQLDAYVFRNELLTWCEKNYSYIGAPWLKLFRTSRFMLSLQKRLRNIGIPFHYEPRYHFSGTGNGGFSLRKVEDCIRALTSTQLCWKALWRLYNPFIINRTEGCKWRYPLYWLLWQYFTDRKNAAAQLRTRFKGPEDVFWHLYAPVLNEEFTPAPPEVANYFSIESMDLERKLALNQGMLPFGAHACFYNEELAGQYRKYFKFIE